MIIRPATRSDFISFYDKPIPMTVRALVADDEGVKGLGGYYLRDGMAVAFTDFKSLRKRDIVRFSHALFSILKKLRFDVIAASNDEDATMLRHFGFEPWTEDVWRLNG